jgi:hypothetical protein
LSIAFLNEVVLPAAKRIDPLEVGRRVWLDYRLEHLHFFRVAVKVRVGRGVHYSQPRFQIVFAKEIATVVYAHVLASELGSLQFLNHLCLPIRQVI